jgi:hypothetical protein
MTLDRDRNMAIAERFFGMLTADPVYGGPERTLE